MEIKMFTNNIYGNISIATPNYTAKETQTGHLKGRVHGDKGSEAKDI